jgi:holliday junction DNA helicase RuvA
VPGAARKSDFYAQANEVMIEFVEGILAAKNPSYAVVQCGGIGWHATISLSTYDGLPAQGQNVRLWTHLYFHEDEFQLFAFATPEERWLFRNLITVNGVGPKLAITALSAAKPEIMHRAITEGDSDRLKSIPRIGSKIAERIVLELKKKLGEKVPDFSVGTESKSGAVREAVDALLALGFSRTEAEKAVDAAVKRGASGVEELIKSALRSS